MNPPRCEYGPWLLDDAADPREGCGDPACVRAVFAPPETRQRLTLALCGWHEDYLCEGGGRAELPLVSRTRLPTAGSP